MYKINQIIAAYKKHPLAKNSSIIFAGSMTANLSAYLYHLFVGRILGPVKYGELIALFSIFYLINVPSIVLQTVLVKYFSILKARKKLGQAKSFLFSVTKKAIALIMIGFAVYLLLIPSLVKFLHISSYWSFVWLYIIFSVFFLSTINGSVFQAYQKFFLSTAITNIGMFLRLVVGVIFAFFGVAWTLFGNVVSNIVMYGVSFLPLGFIVRSKAKATSFTKRSVLTYSIPTFITALGITAIYSVDVVLVKHFFSATDAGIYSSLSILGKIIFFFTAAVGFVLFPVLAEKKEKNKPVKRIILSAIIIVGVLSFGACSIYYLFPQLVVGLLFGKSFALTAQYLGFFGLFISFFSLANLMTQVYLALGKTIIWLFVSGASLFQIVLIWFNHRDIAMVISMNLYVAIGLFIALLLYYPYAKAKT